MTHVPVSAVMPSSEMHFFDVSQSHKLNNNLGINAKYTDPSIFRVEDPRTGKTTEQESGVFKTYESDLEGIEKSGVFHYNKLQGAFSNAPITRYYSITDFTIFNHYIHHHGQVSIPYLSTYSATVLSNPYMF